VRVVGVVVLHPVFDGSKRRDRVRDRVHPNVVALEGAHEGFGHAVAFGAFDGREAGLEIERGRDFEFERLVTAGITPSMSRKGNCLDNAPMESFFHTLKVERVHHRTYATRAEARRDLFAYIKGFYNSRRLHSAIGYRSPADVERMAV